MDISDENNPEYAYNQITSIERFRSDMYYASSYFDLGNAFSKYMGDVLDIDDDLILGMMYSGKLDGLPDSKQFEDDPTTAVEQLRLGLIRVIMPLYEDMTSEHDEFKEWLDTIVPVSLESNHAEHILEECLFSEASEDTVLSCSKSIQCPPRVVRQKLLEDVQNPPFKNGTYDGPWGEEAWLSKKKTRALLKLEVCKDVGLVSYPQAAILRRIYISEYRKSDYFQAKIADK